MGAEHTFSDNLHRNNCRKQGWLEAGAEFHHVETAAGELSGEISGNILWHMEWRDELVGVRRGEDTEMGVRHWEGALFVHGARRVCALCLHPGVMGDQFQQSLWKKKSQVPKQAGLSVHWRTWLKGKQSFFLLTSKCNGVQQKKRSSGGKNWSLSRPGLHL